MDDDVEALAISSILKYHALNHYLPVEVEFAELERWLSMGELSHDEMHGCDVLSVNNNLWFKIFH